MLLKNYFAIGKLKSVKNEQGCLIHMKKGIVLIMMSLLLVACGNGEDKGKEKAEKPTKENTTETLKLSNAEQYKPEGEFKR